jgi:hypothetical protein
MKNKSFILPTIVLLWIIFIFASPAQQKTKWKGTIKKIDGVTVVKNPTEPMHGDDVFHLEEELSIGEERKEDEYIFSEVRDIAVDAEGWIFTRIWLFGAERIDRIRQGRPNRMGTDRDQGNQQDGNST